MVWNLPNSLTILRVTLIPFFVGLAYLSSPWAELWSTAFFSLAALTDWADGYVARRRGELTHFGRFFDPVADKLLVISALVLLVSKDRAPLVLVLIIIAREIAVMALREYMSGQRAVVPVSQAGKWKTAFQMTAIIMLLLHDGLQVVSFHTLGTACLVVATILTVWSGYHYFVSAWPRIGEGG